MRTSTAGRWRVLLQVFQLLCRQANTDRHLHPAVAAVMAAECAYETYGGLGRHHSGSSIPREPQRALV